MRTVKPEITGEEPNILIREPVLKDGLSVHQLVERCPPLDLNSQYAYNLMGGYFAKTCAVAEVDGKIVGFLLGFIPPDKQDRFFVWQVAVDKEHRRGGTAQKLLYDILSRPACAQVRFVEATATPSNEASKKFFSNFATRTQGRIEFSPFLSREDLGGEHEEELLITIGPFTPLHTTKNE